MELEVKYSKTPIIIFTGDLNFPSMKSWDHLEISKFLENVHNRKENNCIIGPVPTQTKILCEFTQDYYLSQFIEHATRKNNLLDLVFTNNIDCLISQEIIDNVLFSDHVMCVVNT